MKIKSLIALAVGALAVAALATGCATTRDTERLLSAAGFKMMPATTPEQRAHLQTLPAGKVTRVVREGTTFFVYPDKEQQALYVGKQAEFDLYQKLRQDNRLAQEQLRAAEMNSEPAYAPWGAWSGSGFVEPVPVYRR